MSLLVISTHPIQYQAPVYQSLVQDFGINVSVVYASNFSVIGYYDREFDQTFSWDTNLLNGYQSYFLSKVEEGGARSVEEVTAHNLRKLVKNLNFSAVLLLGYRWRFDLRAFWIAKQTGKPLLFRSETTDHAVPRSPLKNIIRDYALRWFYSYFDYLLYIGENSKAHYQRLGIPERSLIFSPYCVSTTQFDFNQSPKVIKSLRDQLGITEDKVVLLFSGKLVERKGPDLIFDAVRELPREIRKRIIILFLGDGELRFELETLAKIDPPVEAIFLGFKNQSELSQYYNIADLLVMPSRSSETWGLVVNEALYHGLPCVVSDNVGCSPDLVRSGETGEIFKNGSISDFSNKLEKAINWIEASEASYRCQALAEQYSIYEAARGIKCAYEKVTNKSDQL